MTAVPYTDRYRKAWNAATDRARNATFLFRREYMDYHRDRFVDGSLLFLDEGGEIVGLLPASVHRDEGRVASHGGLTYGGLLLPPEARLTEVRDMLRLAARHYLAEELDRMTYKPVPAIYHRYPADDDLYWLFRAGARLTARTASTALRIDSPLSETLWHRKLKKGQAEGIRLGAIPAERLPEFWTIVEEVLSERHATRPVHTAAEMMMLMRRLPHHIRLFAATDERDRIIAGALAFATGRCLHIQYMETGAEGRRRRALDLLIRHLIRQSREEGTPYFDFGISTEQGGRLLNEGLAYQKEGFGGRTVCYDIYEAELEKLAEL